MSSVSILLLIQFLQRSSAVEEGPRNACRSDLQFTVYVSPGDAWFDRSAVLYCGLVLVELVRSEGGIAHFAPKFRPYQPFLAWSVSGLSSAVEPPDGCAPTMSMTSVVSYTALSHQGGNVLITDVVSNSAKH